MLTPIKKLALTPVLADLAIPPDRVRTPGDPPQASYSGTHHAVVGAPARTADVATVAAEIQSFVQTDSTPDGFALVFLEGVHDERELARWRNALWPFVHVVLVYDLRNEGIHKLSVEGRAHLHRGSGLRGSLLVARRRALAFEPASTVEKFDRNAALWNGEPGSPSYAHFRWMRQLVGTFLDAKSASSPPARILDFGCGAGWVGIEAALRAPGASLCAFDPSAEMTKLTLENARREGLTRVEARTGFGEAPPFPAEGEPRFDLVLASGVISFACDAEQWLDGLVSTLAPGATLVIGDVNRDSRGMRRRRTRKALLPLREMNAMTRDEVQGRLERRGLVHEESAGYQLTRPVPEAMHVSEKRLKGSLHAPLLWLNRVATRADRALGARHGAWFDSWVMRFSRK